MNKYKKLAEEYFKDYPKLKDGDITWNDIGAMLNNFGIFLDERNETT